MRDVPTPPRHRPRGTREILLLAWIAYHAEANGKGGGKAEQEASYLYLRQQFRLSTDNTVERILKRLKGTPNKPRPSAKPRKRKAPAPEWIVVGTPWTAGSGNHYRLGRDAVGDAAQWVRLGQHLFGPAGLLTPHLARPVLYAPPLGFGLNGTLVLAHIQKYGPLTSREVVAAMGPYMDGHTSRTKLDRLVAHDILIRDGDEHYAPRNLSKRLRMDAIAHNGQRRLENDDDDIGALQLAYQVKKLGGPTLRNLRRLLKKLPCFYCKAVPPAKGGTVEHFPPVHWGGSDEYSLLLPACTRCNNSQGGVIRSTPKVPPPSTHPSRIEFPGTAAEAAVMAVTMMAQNAAMCFDHVADGLVNDARKAALDFFPIWMGLKEGMTVINTLTNEETTLMLAHDIDVVVDLVDSIGGITKLLGGTRGDRRSRLAGKA